MLLKHVINLLIIGSIHRKWENTVWSSLASDTFFLYLYTDSGKALVTTKKLFQIMTCSFVDGSRIVMILLHQAPSTLTECDIVSN
jgi:hypothetical protein